MFEPECAKVKFSVEFESQSTQYTCVPKTLQLMLHYLNADRTPLGREVESAFYQRVKLGNYVSGSNISAALVALEEGFSVTLITKCPTVYEYPQSQLCGVMSRNDFEKKMSLNIPVLERALELGLELKVEPVIDQKIIIGALESSGPLVIMTEIDGVLHNMIIRGFANRLFYLVDPLRGYRRMHSAELVRAINTPYGASMLAIRNKLSSMSLDEINLPPLEI